MAGKKSRTCTFGAKLKKISNFSALNDYFDKFLTWISLHLPKEALNALRKIQFRIGTNFWNTMHITRQLYCYFKTLKRRVAHISSFLMTIFLMLHFIFLFTFFDLIWWFINLRYFHIQTSAIKRKYPTLIVRIFLFQRANIQIYSNILGSQVKYTEDSMTWNIPCSSERRVAPLSVK